MVSFLVASRFMNFISILSLFIFYCLLFFERWGLWLERQFCWSSKTVATAPGCDTFHDIPRAVEKRKWTADNISFALKTMVQLSVSVEGIIVPCLFCLWIRHSSSDYFLLHVQTSALGVASTESKAFCLPCRSTAFPCVITCVSFSEEYPSIVHFNRFIYLEASVYGNNYYQWALK